MVNLKKYNDVLKLFVIFLTFLFIVSCSKQNYHVSKIEGKRIPITAKENEVPDQSPQGEQAKQIENFIKPYREHINKDLDSVLAYCPVTLDKSSGKWQTTIGNLLADVSLKRGNLVFNAREKKNIDICLLNHGGIRSIIPKGNVTSRTAFEIMPFENTMVVIALKGEQVFELVDYFIAEKKPHPLSGITFTIDKNNKAKNIIVRGKPVEKETIYYVGTNDYLANGGDNMNFFKKGVQKFDLDYKLRNILIDYFKEVDTIPVINDVRITVE
ncbi:2',3'-cyclic-nucleotide 2'-phosphodiesterase (5'-nucleotidase family) [Flavobacterium sp. CG_23.5]|uniref:5'-nucleotidase C-terminal domain-containing protein n=1 Tax=unclassified Flavobacterium TaxID=196869 RepID=UPI0018CA8B74|nr:MULTISPECIES: 5'-nucleotidase [unclassified Flavobacterium]MBG6110121.1 2',3'-cyclic-nucleotide 2'-phosphodiesterase (5'-nucleotidase family) [Flavobacterium sp. CG_9.10]MBP2281882.1 2',3'-cyclic-nucleotide 2'-phosphodiesterase (5'-nucleotidase family) [Flavobacterium sp. CG_23.5]